MKTLHEEGITAAAHEWGKFSPLKYWVSSVDVDAADKLAEKYCSRMETLGEMSKDDCLENDYTAKFLPETAVKVSAAIQSSDPTSAAGRNGKRDWGIHLFGSSYPPGYGGLLGVPFAEDQVLGFHEYFHAVQHAYIFTLDRDTRDDMLGPMWFVEGGAEFMAQTTTQRLRDAGALTASDWAPLPERMRWKMEAMQKWLVDNPGSKLSEVGYGSRSQSRILLRLMGTRLSIQQGRYGRVAWVVLQKPERSRMGWDFHPNLRQDIGGVHRRVRYILGTSNRRPIKDPSLRSPAVQCLDISQKNSRPPVVNLAY